LAKSGLSDAKISEMRDAMIAAALKRENEMKIISSEVHAALDYLTVAVFALAPTVIGLTGISAILSYVLAAVHLSMTLATDMPFSLVKIVPIRLHALVELMVGPVLVIGGLLLELPTPARTFFVAMGVIIFAVWLLSGYAHSTGQSEAKSA
jgi:hypothetical protein